MFPDLEQLRRIAFINKNIAPEGWTFALLISISCVGTPFFIFVSGVLHILNYKMDKRLPKSECRFYLRGMTLNIPKYTYIGANAYLKYP